MKMEVWGDDLIVKGYYLLIILPTVLILKKLKKTAWCFVGAFIIESTLLFWGAKIIDDFVLTGELYYKYYVWNSILTEVVISIAF